MKKHDIKNLYDTIFSVPFLIRYGYYDVKMKKIESKYVEDDELEERYGTPENFYLKLLSLQDLYQLLKKKNLRSYYNFNNIKNNVDTEPILFNIPKEKFARREYKMPNIFSYLQLCYFLEDNRGEFKSIFENNKQSTSKYFNQLDFDFKFTNKLEQRLLFGGNEILSLDLSNFYHTLYTHSIPWVILGKQNSKSNRNTGFPNDLDSIIQKCQYGETHGIPVGNITSRLIAEFYMCHIDKELLGKGYTYSRYVDDIKFPFSTDSEKEDFLMEVNAICREYNLILNNKKTEIHVFPFKNDRQKTEIFNYFDELSNKSKANTWKNKLNEFIDFCICEESNGNKGAIKCIYSVTIKKFKYLKIASNVLTQVMTTREEITDFNIFEKFLDTALKDSRLSNKFITFTEQLIELGVDKEKLKTIVRAYFKVNKIMHRQKLKNYINNGWNQEVYQLLLYCVIFDEKKMILKSELKTILREDLDDYSKCLSLILWIKKGYKIVELLDILENNLREVHNAYGDKSVRMQEKYWLLRYFVLYLIENGIIDKVSLNNHYISQKIPTNNNIVESELNKEFVLLKDPNKKAYLNKINEFYELLLDENVALVQIGTEGRLFEYL